ncbi:MAG: polysaccharide lyase [Hyphomicrobiales bacterium]|nr:polysaccharide lyase [Hyphomicrobiales bacterium]
MAAIGELERIDRAVLAEDFEGPIIADESPLYYKQTAEQAAGSVDFQSDDVRHGRSTIALSVNEITETDAPLDSERAELWERRRVRLPFGTGVWYAFSMKLTDPIPRDDGRYVVAQWKREIPSGLPGLQSPYLAFRLYRGHLYATVDTDLRDVSGEESETAMIWRRPKDRQMRALVAATPGADLAGLGTYDEHRTDLRVIPRGGSFPAADSGWIDYVVYVRPGPGGDGHIEIFANGGHVVSVFGHIGHADLGPTQYFKFGPYREANKGVWTVFYDRFRRGPTCASVTTEVTCPF